jgi:hypothetical protein
MTNRTRYGLLFWSALTTLVVGAFVQDRGHLPAVAATLEAIGALGAVSCGFLYVAN